MPPGLVPLLSPIPEMLHSESSSGSGAAGKCCWHRGWPQQLSGGLGRSQLGPARRFMALTWSFSCFQIIPNFYPPLEAHVRQGVFNSLTHIVEKRVLA